MKKIVGDKTELCLLYSVLHLTQTKRETKKSSCYQKFELSGMHYFHRNHSIGTQRIHGIGI